jgi:hypothetical protein
MKMSRDIPWPRIFAEGAAIVVSILLAFWIEAWWDSERQWEDELIVLQSLRDDLIRMQHRLAEDITLSNELFDSATKLLRGTPSTFDDPGELDKLISNLLWYNTSSVWESAPMNSLMFGGDISLISNITLAQELAALQVQMDRLQVNYDAEEDFYFQQWVPFLNENADLVRLLLTIEREHGTKAVYKFPDVPVTESINHAELLAKAKFRGLLMQIIDSQLNSRVFAYPQLGEKLDTVVELVQTELERN